MREEILNLKLNKSLTFNDDSGKEIAKARNVCSSLKMWKNMSYKVAKVNKGFTVTRVENIENLSEEIRNMNPGDIKRYPIERYRTLYNYSCNMDIELEKSGSEVFVKKI